MYEDDDQVTKKIPHQISQHTQSSHINHSLLAKIQHNQFDDSLLSHDILINIENSLTLKSNNDSASLTEISHSKAIIQTLIKSKPTSSMPCFFTHCKAFENFFFPSDTKVTIPILLQAQKDDAVLSTVYTWLKKTKTSLFNSNY